MDSLSFVAGHYQDGLFDSRKAYNKLVGKHRQVVFPWLVAAAASVAIGVFLITGYRNARKEYFAYDVTQAFTLPDGSGVLIYPGSSLSVQPHRNPRAVQMSGTIRFNVAKDATHPFTVTAKNAFVEVLGTVFTLSDNPPSVEVTEGRVRFATSAVTEGIILIKGESAVIKDGVPQKKPAFVFDDTPLEEVLATLSDAFGIRLKSSSKGKRLSAEFRGESLKEIVQLIEDALGVRISMED